MKGGGESFPPKRKERGRMKKVAKRVDKVFVGVWLTKKQVKQLKEIGKKWENSEGRGGIVREIIDYTWTRLFVENQQVREVVTPPSFDEVLDNIGE